MTKFVIICTEGSVSEPLCLQELKNSLIGQSPKSGNIGIEIVPIPLGGNQGHKKIILKAESSIKRKMSDSDSILSCCSNDDTFEKWLICDYDKMHKNGIDLTKLRKEALKFDYKLILNKPNFEYFALLLIAGPMVANSTKPKYYIQTINNEIVTINEQKFRELGVSTIKIPPYAKNKYQTIDFFGMIFNNFPELLINITPHSNTKTYTEMNELIEYYKLIFS